VKSEEDMLRKLLKKNTSNARVAGFVLSNFIGLVIVMGALQFYNDARSIWTGEDSFIKTDYMVINKKVSSSNTLGQSSSAFSEEEISDLEHQPWVRSVGRFTSNDFRVYAQMNSGDRGMSTYMFFEAIPDEFVDVPRDQWRWDEGSKEVPIIISKDYLTLYNFGFATSAGMPQMSEGLLSGIPLDLTLRSEDGTREEHLYGRIAGYSNRLNTILVPHEFMESANRRLGSGKDPAPSRLIIDVSSPGDVAIAPYLEDNNMEMAGDKNRSSASFLLKVIVGIVATIGGIITILSLFILLLSISLIMEKNRDTLHRLLMLGYDTKTVGAPYRKLVSVASLLAYVIAMVGVLLLRISYLPALEGLGAEPAGLWIAPVAGLILTGLAILFNLIAIRRKVLTAWRI
jgi:hypothetical protein